MTEDYSGTVGVADTPTAEALVDALLHTYGLPGNDVDTTLSYARNQHRAAAAEIILYLAEQGFEIKQTMV